MTDDSRLPSGVIDKVMALRDAEQQALTTMQSTQSTISERQRALGINPRGDKAAAIQREVTRLQGLMPDYQQRYRALADLNAKVTRFLDMLPADSVVEDAKRPKVKLKGETHQQAVAALRTQIMKLIAERSQVERAALPKDEIRAQAKKWITERAMKGQPTIAASHDAFEVVFAARQENSYSPTLDVLALLAWYDPAYMEDKLNALIDERPEPHLALTPAEKAERLRAIKVELADAERRECALIDDARDSGIIIDHRPNVDIRALLGLTVSKKSAKAA